MQPFVLLALTLFTSLATSAAIPLKSAVSHKIIPGDKPGWHLSKRQQLPSLPPAGNNPPAPGQQYQQGQPWGLDKAPPSGIPTGPAGFPVPNGSYGSGVPAEEQPLSPGTGSSSPTTGTPGIGGTSVPGGADVSPQAPSTPPPE